MLQLAHKARILSEAEEQIQVVEYCELKGIPIYHIPNERKCSAKAGARLKAQGVKAGVPDLCIPIPNDKYHALYIEMKAKGGKITNQQKQWIELLRSNGNLAVVCYGAKNAIALIELYLENQVELVTSEEN